MMIGIFRWADIIPITGFGSLSDGMESSRIAPDSCYGKAVHAYQATFMIVSIVSPVVSSVARYLVE